MTPLLQTLMTSVEVLLLESSSSQAFVDPHKFSGSFDEILRLTKPLQSRHQFTASDVREPQRLLRPQGIPANREDLLPSTSKKPETMAAKILANLIVMGAGILGRAVLQAYRKAIDNANKTGVAHETLNNIRRASRAMTEQEARQILGVPEHATWEEVMQKYDTLFERNAQHGSFYLQSKVHRAKECLEAVYQRNSPGNS